MNYFEYDSYSEENTIDIAEEFAKSLKQGDIVTLSGDMGAGKTAFVRGLVKCTGDMNAVSSPTFTLVNEYSGALPVYHFDLYRLVGNDAIEPEWMDEYLFGDGVCVIEWAENMESVCLLATIKVSMEKASDKNENYRKIAIEIIRDM